MLSPNRFEKGSIGQRPAISNINRSDSQHRIPSLSFASMAIFSLGTCTTTLLFMTSIAAAQQATMPTNPYITLMTAARTHAFAHGVKIAPVLSPEDKILLGDHPELDVA